MSTRYKYRIKWSSRFKKDYKLAIKRNMNISLLDEIIRTLSTGQPLSEKHKDHPLSGNWKDYRECHIEPDWILIYRIEKDVLILTLQRTGTHSDLFNK